MLLFMDGMAHYSTSQIGLKYTAVDSTNTTWSVAAEGRTLNCLKRVAASNTSSGYLDVAPLMSRTGAWSPTASGVCGFAIKIDDFSGLGAPGETGMTTSGTIFAVLDGSNWALKVCLHSTGTFSLIQPWGPLNSYGFPIAISSEGLLEATWMYLEFKWLLHASAGSFQIRVNGVTVLDYTGDTSSHNPSWVAQTKWNAVRLLQLSSAVSPLLTVRMGDFYLADLASAVAADVDDFLGDGTIVVIRPNGIGNSSGWTPDPPALANWDAVNDLTPDGDSTVVRTTASGTRDTYQFENLPTGAIVLGAHYNALGRKESDGSASLAPIVRQGSTDYDGPTQGLASVAYDRYLTQPYDVNPATDAQWTAAEVNAGQFGVLKDV